MQAYISVHQCNGKHNGYGFERGFFADVVSEVDWYEGGPCARSYRSTVADCAETARQEAEYWAKKNGFDVVTLEEMVQ